MEILLSIRAKACSMVEMATQYTINLSEDERLELEDLLSRKRLSQLRSVIRSDVGPDEAYEPTHLSP